MLNLYGNIKKRREQLGISQQELAEAIGYKGKSMISQIEKGDVDLPSSMITKIAEALKCSESYLMGWEEPASFDTPEQFERYWSEHGGGQHPIPISEEEYNLIQEYRTAPEEDRQHARRILSYAKLLRERIGEQSEEIPYLKESPKPYMAASDIPALNNAFAAHKITKKSEKIIKARNKKA